jgi:hypothetical protein
MLPSIAGKLLDTRELHGQSDRKGLAVDGEIAFGGVLAVPATDVGGGELDRRVRLGREEVGREQMGVAVGLVGSS